jgi:hypothetical protein
MMSELTDKLKGIRLPAFKADPSILLQNNTVKPMHGVVPRLILGKEWWDKTRQEAYASTGWRCAACGVYKKDAPLRYLEGHEVYKVDYKRGRQTYIRTIPLCHYCHCFIHSGRLEAMVEMEQVSKKEYETIMSHGNRVLALNGLTKPPLLIEAAAKWEDWRLVLLGKEYPPIYPTYEAWAKCFHPYLEEIEEEPPT